MERGASDDVVLAPPRWPLVTSLTLAVLFFASLLVGSVLLLGVDDVFIPVLLCCDLAMMGLLAWPVITALGSGKDALTADGLRFRESPMILGTDLLPWSRIASLGIDAIGSTRYLRVVPTDVPAYLGGLGRPSRLTALMMNSRYGAPVMVPLGSSITDQRIREAVGQLSRGRLAVDDDGQTGAPMGLRRVAWLCGAMGGVLLLMVALVPLIQPWERAWWPGVHEASALPAPCEAVAGENVQALMGEVQPTSDAYDDGLGTAMASCGYAGDAESLTVMYLRYDFEDGVGASERAHVSYDMTLSGYFSLYTDRSEVDLGDEAVIGAQNSEYSGTLMLLRRANVVIEIDYSGGDDPATVKALVTGLGSQALDAIVVD